MFLVRISTKKREWLGAFLLFLPTFLLLPIEFFGYKLLPFPRDSLELFVYTLIHLLKHVYNQERMGSWYNVMRHTIYPNRQAQERIIT